jgi:Immunity protein 26
MKKLPYSEGSVFLVPLEGGGYASGIVARLAPKGKILLGYFFGPRIFSPADIRLESFRAKDALLVKYFGDLGLIRGYWPIINNVPDWSKAEWPVMDTVRRDPLGRLKPVLVRYADDDPSKVIGEQVLENDLDLPNDGLAGYGYVEAVLSKKLQ